MSAEKENEELRNQCRNLSKALTECNEEKAELKILKHRTTLLVIGVVIQLFVGVAIWRSVHYAAENISITQHNINRQDEFNRTSLNPWVYVIPVDSLYIQQDTLILWRYVTKCVGRSPGLRVKCYVWLTTQVTSHLRDIRYEDKQTTDKIGQIFPQQKIRGERTRKLSDMGFTIKNFPEKLAGGDTLFCHYHILYQDFNKNEYYVGGTYVLHSLRNIRDREIWQCRWEHFDSYGGQIEKKIN